MRDYKKEALLALSHASLDDVTFVGKKPWFLRAISRGQFLAGAAVVSLSAVFWSAPISVSSMMVAGAASANAPALSEFRNAPGRYENLDVSNGFILSKALNEVSEPLGDKNSAVVPLLDPNLNIANSDIGSALSKLMTKYPDIALDELQERRDVSKAFLGKNNFLALAAEMEGFSGELYKDPAVGLNIGFGYNITKRIGSYGVEAVKNDLLSLSIKPSLVDDIVKLSKLPQRKLAPALLAFNKSMKNGLGKANHEIIDMKQGVALLMRTEEGYKNDARNVFSKSFDRMGANQQQVMTYVAYKVGPEALSKYNHTIAKAAQVFGKSKYSLDDVRSVAKNMTFYYSKDGKEMVLDERASLISNMFVTDEYLAVQIGKREAIHTPINQLMAKQLDFSAYVVQPGEKPSEKVIKNVQVVPAKLLRPS